MSDTTSTYGIPSEALGPWAASLQPASWRGVPFAVSIDVMRGGRRVALHEYPYRDDPWPEDIGRAARRIAISGFLLGDDVFDQRASLVAAFEKDGPGDLVHPSLGSFTAVLDGDYTISMRTGRRVDLEFGVIRTDTAQPSYPVTDVSTPEMAADAADSCDVASAADFVADVGDALLVGITVVNGCIATTLGFVATVIGTVQAVKMTIAGVLAIPGEIVGAALGFVGSVVGLANDAAISAGMALGLIGNFGRYAFGALTAPLSTSATFQSQVAAQTASRAAVDTAMLGALVTASTGPIGLPAAIQGAVSSLLLTIPNPADQLRLLGVLAAYNPPVSPATAPIGNAISTAQTALAALIRRAACAALVRAAAKYQPSSYNDAIAQLDALTALLDAEALFAADIGDDLSYNALRSVRTTVTTDLVTRGASLPTLITITRAVAVPSLVLAFDLYGDATRSDDLIARANPINPAFMPTRFTALSA